VSRQLLDARIRAHDVIAGMDKILANAAGRESRIEWLTGLVRSGQPLPDTPEGKAEYERICEHLERAAGQPVTARGRVEWDGIWRSHG